MKKSYFFILLVALWSCEKGADVEVVKNYDIEYLSMSNVSEPVKIKNPANAQKQIAELEKEILEETGIEENKLKFLILSYRFYVDENGEVDKIMMVSHRNNILSGFIDRERISRELLDKLDLKISQFAGQTEFVPAVKEGKKVKSSFDLVKSGLINTSYYWGYVDASKNLNDAFFVAVEEMPEPIGGMDAIVKNIKYPELAKRAGIEGRVFVKAFIDETGQVVKAEIIKSVHQVLDSAAMDAITKTKFLPGKQRGKPVKTQVAVPIVFKLK